MELVLTRSASVNYSVISRLDCGGYRCELQIDDLHSAVHATHQRAQATQRSHYLIDRKGKVVTAVNPPR